MPVSKFESMLKTNSVFFFDSADFETIIDHYLTIGKHSLAKKAVKLGLDQHPSSVPLKLLLVELMIFEGAFNTATKLLSEIECLEPNNDEVFMQKATIYSKGKKHNKAINVLRKALDFTEDPQEIWAMLGMEYIHLEDYQNAKQSFKECIALDIEDYASLYNLMYCIDMEGGCEEAIVYLNDYLEKNPYSEIAWHQLGIQYYDLGIYKEALPCFEYAVLIDDTFIGGYFEKAKTLEKQAKYHEAIVNYTITTELDDPTAYAYFRIGECYQKLGNSKASFNFFKKAVHEDPLLDKAWMKLTDVCYMEKEYNKALYYINKALQIDPQNALFWRKSGEVNQKLSMFEEAVISFYKYFELDGKEIDVYVTLIDILIGQSEINEALEVLHNASYIHKDFAELEYRFFGIYYLLEKNNLAKFHLQKALAIDYEYCFIVEELFPSLIQNQELVQVISEFKKTV